MSCGVMSGCRCRGQSMLPVCNRITVWGLQAVCCRSPDDDTVAHTQDRLVRLENGRWGVGGFEAAGLEMPATLTAAWHCTWMSGERRRSTRGWMPPACATAARFTSLAARLHRVPCELHELWGHERLTVSGTVNAAGTQLYKSLGLGACLAVGHRKTLKWHTQHRLVGLEAGSWGVGV